MTRVPGDITISTPRGNIVASSGGILQVPLDGNTTAGPTVQLTAGSRDAQGNVAFVGNIDVSGSGVIGEAVNATATGTINGLLIGSHSVNIATPQTFTGTVVSAGTASISASSVSGNIIAVNGISIGEGTVVNANLLAQSVTGGGASQGLSTVATASTACQSANTDANALAKTATGQDSGTNAPAGDEGKTMPLLAQLVGRVTVILPGK